MAEATKHYNIEAEKELLSRIFRDPDIFISLVDSLDPTDFHDSTNQIIYSSMVSTMREGKAISPTSIYDKLRGSDISISLLMEISGLAAATSDYTTYRDIVKEHSEKRKLLRLLRGAAKDLESKSHEEVILKLNSSLYKTSQQHIKGDIQSDAAVMEEALNSIEQAMKTNNESNGMRTGIRTLDTGIKGFRKGDLILIAARPSMGKTLMMLNVAERLAVKYKIAIFELEMTATKLAYRRLAAKATIPMNRIYDPQTMSEGEWQALTHSISSIASKDRMIIDTTPRLSIEHLRNKVHYIKSTRGLDAIFVDHIGLMPIRKGIASRNEGLGEITASLKAIAKEFDISVICLSQLNRAVEARSDKRPMLVDLRDSGSLEQDSDLVMMLYRDGYYSRDKDEDIPDSEPLEIIIAKNRDGATGTITLKARLAYQSLSDYDYD